MVGWVNGRMKLSNVGLEPSRVSTTYKTQVCIYPGTVGRVKGQGVAYLKIINRSVSKAQVL